MKSFDVERILVLASISSVILLLLITRLMRSLKKNGYSSRDILRLHLIIEEKIVDRRGRDFILELQGLVFSYILLIGFLGALFLMHGEIIISIVEFLLCFCLFLSSSRFFCLSSRFFFVFPPKIYSSLLNKKSSKEDFFKFWIKISILLLALILFSKLIFLFLQPIPKTYFTRELVETLDNPKVFWNLTIISLLNALFGLIALIRFSKAEIYLYLTLIFAIAPILDLFSIIWITEKLHFIAFTLILAFFAIILATIPILRFFGYEIGYGSLIKEIWKPGERSSLLDPLAIHRILSFAIALTIGILQSSSETFLREAFKGLRV